VDGGRQGVPNRITNHSAKFRLSVDVHSFIQNRG
jgi:hypothetical protein